MDELDAYFGSVAGARKLAEGEWGVSAEAGGSPLEIGVRIAHGRLTAQAWAAPAGRCDPGLLLHRNRASAYVRYAATRAGEVWVIGDIPAEAAGPARVDELLGRLVEAAAEARA